MEKEGSDWRRYWSYWTRPLQLSWLDCNSDDRIGPWRFPINWRRGFILTTTILTSRRYIWGNQMYFLMCLIIHLWTLLFNVSHIPHYKDRLVLWTPMRLPIRFPAWARRYLGSLYVFTNRTTDCCYYLTVHQQETEIKTATKLVTGADCGTMTSSWQPVTVINDA